MPLTDRDRRTLIIGGVILGVLLLGFFLFNSLAGGGGEEALPPVPPVTGSPSAGTGGGSGSPSVEPTNTAQPPVFTGRDPFSIPPALAPPTSISPTSGTTSPSSGTGTISPTTTSPTTSSPSTPGGGSSTVKGGKTVVLLDVFEQNGEPMVDVEVDGNVFNNVGIGDRFGGGSFELRSVAGDCATFLFGDEPFTLCANSTK